MKASGVIWQLQLTSISCMLDPNYGQQAEHDDANGRQDQRHLLFPSNTL